MMLDAEQRCSECGLPTYQRRGTLAFCDDCYRKLFEFFPPPENEEPDFELKHEVAQISATDWHSDFAYLKTSDKLFRVKAENTIHLPKRVVFNPDARAIDYEKLVVFLLENMEIYDNAKGFDKVNWMFKELDK